MKYGEIMGGNGNGFEIDDNELICCITLPKTNSSPLKIGGWKTILSFWETLFSGAKMLVYHFGYVSLAMGGGGCDAPNSPVPWHIDPVIPRLIPERSLL